MILVRLVFQAKFGMGGALAKEFKTSMRQLNEVSGNRVHARVLTDLSGPFDTVVQEMEVESLAEWERMRVEAFSRPEFQESFARTAGMIKSGRNEYYTIEG